MNRCNETSPQRAEWTGEEWQMDTVRSNYFKSRKAGLSRKPGDNNCSNPYFLTSSFSQEIADLVLAQPGYQPWEVFLKLSLWLLINSGVTLTCWGKYHSIFRGDSKVIKVFTYVTKMKLCLPVEIAVIIARTKNFVLFLLEMLSSVCGIRM